MPILKDALKFQSSPAPKSGCNFGRSALERPVSPVSILTRSEERVQLW